MENNLFYTYYRCKFSHEKTVPVLLYNALNPDKKIEFIDIKGGNTRVRKAKSIFGGKTVLCPSVFIKDVFTVGVFSPEHEYAFLKRLE